MISRSALQCILMRCSTCSLAPTVWKPSWPQYPDHAWNMHITLRLPDCFRAHPWHFECDSVMRAAPCACEQGSAPAQLPPWLPCPPPAASRQLPLQPQQALHHLYPARPLLLPSLSPSFPHPPQHHSHLWPHRPCLKAPLCPSLCSLHPFPSFHHPLRFARYPFPAGWCLHAAAVVHLQKRPRLRAPWQLRMPVGKFIILSMLFLLQQFLKFLCAHLQLNELNTMPSKVVMIKMYPNITATWHFWSSAFTGCGGKALNQPSN